MPPASGNGPSRNDRRLEVPLRIFSLPDRREGRYGAAQGVGIMLSATLKATRGGLGPDYVK
jgi:hypothetical protein